MSQINLLPWREERKKCRNQVFYGVLCACMGVTSLGVLLVHGVLLHWQRTEQANIFYLQSEIKKIDHIIQEVSGLQAEKEELVKRMQVINVLQSQRFSLVRLLDTMARITPEGLLLTELSRKINHIQIQGVADTNASISTLLRNLEQIECFVQVKLSEISYHKKQMGLIFKIELEQDEAQDAG
jgi:type IV pilus assembly protein PilN